MAIWGEWGIQYTAKKICIHYKYTAWVFYIVLMVLATMVVVVIVALMVFNDEVREWLIERAIILL